MGRIIVHTHGRPRERAYSRLVEIYSERLATNSVKLNQHSEKLSHDEYVRKLELAAEGATLILLDERGESGTTEWFTNYWKNWKLSSTNIHLAIGPVDGYQSHVIEQHPSISLGPLTMTYEMAAVVLLEQLYRASERDRGSPYHRD
ncbi:MAG TPA: 23S rRNA (pseudouridine(1915)-N(3))-methyltransferase RlmH [Candidatus Thalassarchaeaceae archaeon]|nr:23S rRNA (pseudouridine(1915)-N(3))-methyltransferase RlmH [Candidatus Thalassarchaeaceae archaeon]